jgi:holo-[acyl-carrier protein] synthase
MSLRVGIDLASVDSVRDAIAAHGTSYLERIYSQQEIADCSTDAGVDPQRLAARFAAKEAAFKALRVGDTPMSWQDVEVQRDPAGWVKLCLKGNAAGLAREAGITALSLSLTHEHGCAAAVVIAETSADCR